MHAALTFGSVRLSAHVAVPGRSGEARRLAEDLRAADPGVVAAEIDPAHALALRQHLAGAKAEVPFLARLVVEEAAARHRGEADDLFLAAARHAREADVPLVPLLPPERQPGFFERRRVRKTVASVPSTGDEAAFAIALETALRSEPKVRLARADGDAGAARGLADLLFKQGCSRVASVLTAGRADAILDGVRRLAPAGPPARRVEPAEVKRPDAYPAYR